VLIRDGYANLCQTCQFRDSRAKSEHQLGQPNE